MTIKVVGQKSGGFVEVETNTRAMRSVVRPLDVIEDFGGAYSVGIPSFLNESTSILYAWGLVNYGPKYLFVRKIILSVSVNSQTVANTGTFSLYPCHAPSTLSLSSTYILLPGPYTKLRSSMPDPVGVVLYGSFASSPPFANMTIDSQSIASVPYSYTATVGSIVLAPVNLLDGVTLPLVLEPWEGLLMGLIAAASSSNSLRFSVTCCWEERDEF